jgi:septal ring factor EnvC (AmiA/AmiB activator)
MMNTKLLYPFLAVMIFPLLNAGAQVAKDRVEKVTDRVEILSSRQQLNRDQAELAKFRTMVDELKLAYLSGNDEQLINMHSLLISEMDREIAQSERKTQSAGREVRRSVNEVGNSRKEEQAARINQADKRNHPLHRNGKDVRDTRDDLRDARDDRRDHAERANRMRQQNTIRRRFANAIIYNMESDSPDEIPQIVLLNKFIETLESDILATKKELGEDRGELREDRREIREDRRERRRKL